MPPREDHRADRRGTGAGGSPQTAVRDAAERGNPATRALLMHAAQQVLDRKGILDATVADFTREAGVGHGTFYIYFKDKYDVLKALYRAVNQEVYEQAMVRPDRRLPPYERLRVSLRGVMAVWAQHAGVLRSLTQMALVRPDFFALNQELRWPFIHRIRRDLESSIARGHARPVDPAVAAKALAAMMDWLCLLWFAQDEPPYPGVDVDHAADQLALLWYRAVYAADPPEA